MIESLKLNLPGKRRLTSLLGLTLEGGRIEGVVLRRDNGSLQVQQSVAAALSLDPLTADPELVGREIRNHLDAAGVKERHCVLGLPLKWALTTHIDVPAMEPGDVASFLQIEAERGFPCDAATLQIASSRCQETGGKQYALLAGIPGTHVSRLEQVLHAAKLKPVSFTLGIAALQSAAAGAPGVLALVIGETQVGLQITCGGGVAALRSLEGAVENDGGRRGLNADLVVREARITLGQLPAELRDAVKRIRIFGPRDLAQRLADELELRLEPMGLAVEVAASFAPGEFGAQLPETTPVTAGAALAAARLGSRVSGFEFLPPRLTPLQQMAARYSSGKLRMAGAAAAALLVITVLLFGVQQFQLARLQSQWKAMSPKVRELEQVQQQIHLYRPWFDESFRGLSILRQLTLAFPEDGSVSAKSIELREAGIVTCTGVARDNQALLKTMEKLNSTPGISDFHRGQMRGKSPIQFTFDFRWTQGGRNEN